MFTGSQAALFNSYLTEVQAPAFLTGGGWWGGRRETRVTR